MCSDSTGTVPVILENELVIQLSGKTVYDLAADDDQVTHFFTHPIGVLYEGLF